MRIFYTRKSSKKLNMTLQDWIQKNLQELGPLTIWARDEKGRLGSQKLTEIDEYPQFLKNNNETLFYSCFHQTSDRDIIYVLWNPNLNYKIQIYFYRNHINLSEDLINNFFQNVFGKPDWFMYIRDNYPEIFYTCGKCPCYNDKLITGECRNNYFNITYFR